MIVMVRQRGRSSAACVRRPWRVAEGRLHSATELVVSRNQSLLHFQEKLHERFKGLLTVVASVDLQLLVDPEDMANKENQPKEASDQDRNGFKVAFP